jgi:hypothetical protein
MDFVLEEFTHLTINGLFTTPTCYNVATKTFTILNGGFNAPPQWALMDPNGSYRNLPTGP